MSHHRISNGEPIATTHVLRGGGVPRPPPPATVPTQQPSDELAAHFVSCASLLRWAKAGTFVHPRTAAPFRGLQEPVIDVGADVDTGDSVNERSWSTAWTSAGEGALAAAKVCVVLHVDVTGSSCGRGRLLLPLVRRWIAGKLAGIWTPATDAATASAGVAADRPGVLHVAPSDMLGVPFDVFATLSLPDSWLFAALRRREGSGATGLDRPLRTFASLAAGAAACVIDADEWDVALLERLAGAAGDAARIEHLPAWWLRLVSALSAAASVNPLFSGGASSPRDGIGGRTGRRWLVVLSVADGATSRPEPVVWRDDDVTMLLRASLGQLHGAVVPPRLEADHCTPLLKLLVVGGHVASAPSTLSEAACLARCLCHHAQGAGSARCRTGTQLAGAVPRIFRVLSDDGLDTAALRRR